MHPSGQRAGQSSGRFSGTRLARHRWQRGLLCLFVLPLLARADEGPLIMQPVEALLGTTVSSVLRHASELADAPAAMTVLRREDIVRLGAHTLPDLLRTVPGLHVAQIDNNRWAVAARGFNGFFGSKLLVLIDGRSIYNAIYSGVFWDAHDIPLDNIARIEIIRGPGAALWGANAVNGIINIVTFSAHETTGGQIGISAGNQQAHRLDARWGETTTTGTAWRTFVRQQARNSTEPLPGRADPKDDSRALRAGFRADSRPGSQSWMLGGEVYDNYSGGAAYPQPTSNALRGHHLLGRFNQRLDYESTLQVQAYLDHSWRQESATGNVLVQDVVDLDLQYHLEPSPSHQIIWGGGWRQYRFDSTASDKLAFTPGGATRSIGNLFIQDEWWLVPDTLQLISGIRLEQASSQKAEWLPNLRLLWRPSSRHTLWAAAGRAVRTPNLVDTRIRFAGPGIGAPGTMLYGNADFRPEQVESLEIGWRGQLSPTLASDLALYRSHYRNLQTIEPQPDGTALRYYNHGKGWTEGVEWAIDWQAANRWLLRGGLTLYREQLHFSQPEQPGALISYRGAFPARQAFLRSLWEISPAQRLDVTWRAVGPIRDGVSGYATLDLRWACRLRHDLDLAITGRNLTGPVHREMGDQPYFQETRVRPEITGTLTWHF